MFILLLLMNILLSTTYKVTSVDGDVYLKSDVAPWINEGVHNACMTLFEKGDFEYEGCNDQPDCDKERMAYED